MQSRLYNCISVLVVIISFALFSQPLNLYAATTDKDLTLDDGSGDSPKLILRDETGDKTLTLQKMDAGEAEIVNNEGDINLKPSGDTEEYKHVEYNGLVGILIEAVKELKSENEQLKERLVKLESERKVR